MFFEKTQIRITVDRDSICMGDDIESHQKEFIYDKGTTFENFADIVEKYKLPEIYGEWVLNTKSKKKLFVYKQDKHEIEFLIPPDELIEDYYDGLFIFYHKHYKV